MIGYHGTTSGIAANLQAGNVNVTLGGGELGRGFYTGEHLWTAKTWAANRFGYEPKNVVEFNMPDEEVLELDVQIIGGSSATIIRSNLRRDGLTRTHMFSCDMVWSPIVGSTAITCEQHKWESHKSQTFLNGPIVTRVVF